jgi:FG-GAP repeat
VTGHDSAGSVNILYGSSSGLVGAGSQLWHQDVVGIADKAEFLDEFGFDLGAGDYDGDGFADLTVGVPSEGLAFADQGAAHVLYGSPGGLTAERAQFWSQDSRSVRDVGEAGDMFGATVLAGAWGGHTLDDLAIAATWEDVPPMRLGYEGLVHLLTGGPEGLTSDADQLWSQEKRGVLEQAEEFDFFGTGLA